MDQQRLEINQVFKCLGADIVAWADSHGFKQPTSISDDDLPQVMIHLLLLQAEVSEAAEAVRTGDLPNFREELADVAIRLVGLAHGMGIDLGQEITRKMSINRTRPYRNGKRI